MNVSTLLLLQASQADEQTRRSRRSHALLLDDLYYQTLTRNYLTSQALLRAAASAWEQLDWTGTYRNFITMLGFHAAQKKALKVQQQRGVLFGASATHAHITQVPVRDRKLYSDALHDVWLPTTLHRSSKKLSEATDSIANEIVSLPQNKTKVKHKVSAKTSKSLSRRDKNKRKTGARSNNVTHEIREDSSDEA
ncbi:hypothetical protein PsorP6_005604 [Peronosclerospora sorghi]|uniref:Uncharacterized protein n=1 Tax=Peronosclerospora sorghi TaxID=230839 RepID=A0ACC0W1U1_9STRA|nr:hypothetical protein PsorP6_005604 [Peronosclerospora sorghi]